MSELLFPRTAEAQDYDFHAQRELAHWTISELESPTVDDSHDALLHPNESEIRALVEQAHAAIDTMNRVGVESGVLTPEL